MSRTHRITFHPIPSAGAVEMGTAKPTPNATEIKEKVQTDGSFSSYLAAEKATNHGHAQTSTPIANAMTVPIGPEVNSRRMLDVENRAHPIAPTVSDRDPQTTRRAVRTGSLLT
jgi:hypothetical protein